MVIEPGPDRTVGPENPWTVQIHGLFKVRNRSMPKKHGTVRPAVRPSGSVNRDRFGRFGRFGLFQSLNDVVHFFFFFFPKRRRSDTAPAFFVLSLLYGVVLCFVPLSKSLKPFLISLVSALSQSLWNGVPLSKITLKSSHSQILAPSHFTAPSSPSHFTAPLRRRTSQLPRAVALRSSLVSSHFAATSSPSQLSPGMIMLYWLIYDCITGLWSGFVVDELRIFELRIFVVGFQLLNWNESWVSWWCG